jgi:hypothetical protein
MRFRLRTLMLLAAVVPPVVWLACALWRPDPERPLKWPDPIGLIAVVTWLAVYYQCVHKRLRDATVT